MIRFISIALLCVVPFATNADALDPDWPCQQIKVPGLSLAAVWSGPPVDPLQADWKDDQQIADLVQKIAPRRQPLEQAQILIQQFAQQAGENRQPRLLALLAGIFSVLNAERDSVLAGLNRFGVRQKELAAGLRADNEKLHTLQHDQTADAETVQQATRQVTWALQAFLDRRQAITYACEAPARIEQRLFAIAREIQQELQ